MCQRTERNESIDKAACWRNRQALALLAAGSLQGEGEAAESLKRHIETCSGCRQYWQELTEVAAGLIDSHLEADLELSAAFHHKLMRRLRHESAGAPRRWTMSEALVDLFEKWWQTAGAAGALIIVLLVIAFVAVWPSKNRASTSRSMSSYAGLNQSAKPQKDPSPTLAAYETAASQSLETFDALLTRQANRPTPTMPVYRASPFTVSLAE